MGLPHLGSTPSPASPKAAKAPNSTNSSKLPGRVVRCVCAPPPPPGGGVVLPMRPACLPAQGPPRVGSPARLPNPCRSEERPAGPGSLSPSSYASLPERRVPRAPGGARGPAPRQRLLRGSSRRPPTSSSCLFVSSSILRMSSMVRSTHLSSQQNSCLWKFVNRRLSCYRKEGT